MWEMEPRDRRTLKRAESARRTSEEIQGCGERGRVDDERMRTERWRAGNG